MSVYGSWFDELDGENQQSGGSPESYFDVDGGGIQLTSDQISSSNFDGGIPKSGLVSGGINVSDVRAGDFVYWRLVEDNTVSPSLPAGPIVIATPSNIDDFNDYDGEVDVEEYDSRIYLVLDIEIDDTATDPEAAATMRYLYLEDEEDTVKVSAAGNAKVSVIREAPTTEWDAGTTGWMITSTGNAIFSNILARGTIQANSGYLNDLDVNGRLDVYGGLIISGQPDLLGDTDTSINEDNTLGYFKFLADPSLSAKNQPSIVMNKNGFIIRGYKNKDSKELGVEPKLKVPLDGSKLYFDGDLKVKDPDPPGGGGNVNLTEGKLEVGTDTDNITIRTEYQKTNGQVISNKAIFTRIDGERTIWEDAGAVSGSTRTTGFLMQMNKGATDSGYTARLKIAGQAGYLKFDGANLDISGNIRAKTGFIGGETSGWAISTDTIESVGGSPNKIYLINNVTNPKITITSDTVGKGSHGAALTPFYADATGKFSLLNQLIFTPGSGTTSETTVTGWTITNNSPTITLGSTSGLTAGMTIIGDQIASSTHIKTINSSTSITMTKNAIGNGTNQSLKFILDDFAELQVVGRIRGAIDSTVIIGSPRLATEINSISIVSGIMTVTTTGHAFLTNERVLLENFTGTWTSLNREFVIRSATSSLSFTIDVSALFANGSDSWFSNKPRAILRELTMGLHPQEGSPSDSWYHTEGTGIRLDKFNWWFTNNQFRVGTGGNFIKWDGTTLRVTGQVIGSTFTIQDTQQPPQTGTNIPLTGVITFRSISTGGVVSPAYIEIDNWDSSISLSNSIIPTNQGSFRIFGSTNVLLSDPNDIQSVKISSQIGNDLSIQRLGGGLFLGSSNSQTTVRGNLEVNGTFSPSSLNVTNDITGRRFFSNIDGTAADPVFQVANGAGMYFNNDSRLAFATGGGTMTLEMGAGVTNLKSDEVTVEKEFYIGGASGYGTRRRMFQTTRGQRAVTFPTPTADEVAEVLTTINHGLAGQAVTFVATAEDTSSTDRDLVCTIYSKDTGAGEVTVNVATRGGGNHPGGTILVHWIAIGTL